MEEHPVSMAILVEFVHRVSSASLERVAAAHALGQDLSSDADALFGHFIDEARTDGHSWTAIGERLGVSKQAARQRFAQPARLDTVGGFRLMPRLQLSRGGRA